MAAQLLTIREVAEALRVKTATIRAWVLYRKVKFHKVGGRILFKASDIDQLIEQSAVVPAAKGKH